jgi:trans-2,3-dihydro-3-hydroxyanthranilate isomerase
MTRAQPAKKRRYVTADVFTDRMFGGNPLAVVLDAEGLSTVDMQALALEFNYSETTFVLPPDNPAHTAKVRIFTPRTEVPFAGHPNVGTAFVLARESPSTAAAAASAAGMFLFEERAGLVPLTLLREHGATVGAELVELGSRDALRRSKPNVAAHAALLPLDGADAIFAYWRARDQPPASDEAVLHARMFSPLDGIVEDPATGSACAATIALLATLESHEPADRAWRIHQGVDMGRPSLLLGRTVTHHGAVTATHIGGRCVAVLEGTLVL